MKTLVAWRRDRLGGRLKNFIYAWQLANFLQVKMITMWRWRYDPENEDFDFFKLFDREKFQEHLDIEILHEDDLSGLNDLLNSNFDSLRDIPKFLSLADEHGGDPVLRHSTTGTFLTPQDIGTDVHRAAAELFWSLPLHPDIQAAMASLQSVDTSGCLAIHVRRGDVMTHCFGGPAPTAENLVLAVNGIIHKYIPLETYLRIIPDVGRVLIFSDSPADRKALKARIGDRAIDADELISEFVNLNSVQRSLCSILLMSRAETIYAPVSNFSALAWTLGGGNLIEARRWVTAAEIITDVSLRVDAMDVPVDIRRDYLASIISGYINHFRKRRGVEDETVVLENYLDTLISEPQPL